MVREGGLEPPRPEWTLEPESAEVFDLRYGFCFPLRCCRFWQPRLDFPNTALDCGIFVIYIEWFCWRLFHCDASLLVAHLS